MIETDSKIIPLGQIKSLTLLSDAKNVYSFTPKPNAKVVVEIKITQATL